MFQAVIALNSALSLSLWALFPPSARGLYLFDLAQFFQVCVSHSGTYILWMIFRPLCKVEQSSLGVKTTKPPRQNNLSRVYQSLSSQNTAEIKMPPCSVTDLEVVTVHNTLPRLGSHRSWIEQEAVLQDLCNADLNELRAKQMVAPIERTIWFHEEHIGERLLKRMDSDFEEW